MKDLYAHSIIGSWMNEDKTLSIMLLANGDCATIVRDDSMKLWSSPRNLKLNTSTIDLDELFETLKFRIKEH